MLLCCSHITRIHVIHRIYFHIIQGCCTGSRILIYLMEWNVLVQVSCQSLWCWNLRILGKLVQYHHWWSGSLNHQANSNNVGNCVASVIVFQKEYLQLPAPSQCWKFLENINTFSYLLKTNSAQRGLIYTKWHLLSQIIIAPQSLIIRVCPTHQTYGVASQTALMHILLHRYSIVPLSYGKFSQKYSQ